MPIAQYTMPTAKHAIYLSVGAVHLSVEATILSAPVFGADQFGALFPPPEGILPL